MYTGWLFTLLRSSPEHLEHQVVPCSTVLDVPYDNEETFLFASEHLFLLNVRCMHAT